MALPSAMPSKVMYLSKESVHLKIYIICDCHSLKISDFVKEHQSRMDKSTMTGLLETTFARRVNLPEPSRMCVSLFPIMWRSGGKISAKAFQLPV
jgi:hypothetical protein